MCYFPFKAMNMFKTSALYCNYYCSCRKLWQRQHDSPSVAMMMLLTSSTMAIRLTYRHSANWGAKCIMRPDTVTQSPPGCQCHSISRIVIVSIIYIDFCRVMEQQNSTYLYQWSMTFALFTQFLQTIVANITGADLEGGYNSLHNLSGLHMHVLK